MGKKDAGRSDASYDDAQGKADALKVLDAEVGSGEVSRKLSGKRYARELKRLHVELVKLQEWVRHKGLKVCVLFEGRDGAGKGGTIKAIAERVSPRVFRVVACIAGSD
jgi:polyphosphate kinase 2 (PPK2 family)